MKTLLRFFLTLGLIAGLLLSAWPVFAAPSVNTTANYAPDHILVKFKTGVAGITAQADHKLRGNSILRQIDPLHIQVIKVPDGKVQDHLKAYRQDPLVDYAEPDYLFKAIGTPDDPGFDLQWGLTTIWAPQSWNVTAGNPDIKIAVLDTGIDQDHEDLSGKIVANQNFSSSATADDMYGHGTHVAGIAAASANNGKGVAGVACNAGLMNGKVLDDSGIGDYSWAISGITWAADNGAKVINMSFGGTEPSSFLEEAVNYAWNHGVVVVAAAGNYGNSTPLYPAYYANCISVAAVNRISRRASFSSFGSWVDLAAPGVDIYSTLPNHETNRGIYRDYGYASGASMAAPFVSGLAALVWSTPYGINTSAVRSRIQNTADPISGTGIYWQYGLINAFRAVGGTGIPKIVTRPAGNITSASATLNGTLVSLDTFEASVDVSNVSVNVCFEYGTSENSYTDVSGNLTLTGSGDFHIDVSGLSPDLTYYFRAKATGAYTNWGTQEMFNIWTSPPEGKIAFISDFSASAGICVMNADGSNPRSFFDPPMGPFEYPVWSPDGKKLAFINHAGAPNPPFPSTNGDIFTADENGSHILNLTNSDNLDDFCPAWSPDGTRIAYESGVDECRNIYVMQADGTDQTRLTFGSGIDANPAWSPDGNSIVFISNPTGNFDLYIMNSDGSNVTRLTHSPEDEGQPAISPDGSKIVFGAFTPGVYSHFEIYLMDINGNNLQQLTSSPYGAEGPEWSPDGMHIVFSYNYLEGNKFNSEIFIMKADGSNQQRLTNIPGGNFQPNWNPNNSSAIDIVTDTLPPAEVKAAYPSQTLAAVGGTPPYKWAKVGAWPAGLKISKDGVISGTPRVKITEPTEYTLTIKVTDSSSTVTTGLNGKDEADLAAKPANHVVTKPLTLTIYPALNITLPNSTKTLTSLPAADAGSPYACSFSASGGKAPYVWSKGADFPEWLDIDADTGEISGTPTTDGTIKKVNIIITDSLGYALTRSPSLKVNKPLTITTASLPASDIGVAYKKTTLKASGGKKPYTWSIRGDIALPGGLVMTSKGLISGAPAVGSAGTYPLTFQVSDGIGTASVTLPLIINPDLAIGDPPEGKAGESYNLTLSTLTTGGSGTGYKFTLKGTLPPGLKFTAKTGAISGTPTAAGSYPLIVKVTDSLKGSFTREITIIIKPE